MIIKRLSASFGILQEARLKLDSGLNIIHAPNERGKSTWCAFIRAMLYGINTAEREKDGFLPEKTKYRPWSGIPMAGVMEVEAEGRSIAIQRTALGASPMKRLDVRYSGTGEEVISLMHENLGETLTGVPEAVFVRSAFIRQAGIKVLQTGQLEQRIAALVSSGDEGISYSDTSAILGAWQRKRRHNKSGQIPNIEGEIAVLDQTLARLAEASETYNEINLDLDRALARRTELQEDLNVHAELEHRIQRQKIAEAKQKVQDLDWELIALKKKLTQNGAQVSKDLITGARETYDKLSGLTMRYTQAKGKKEDAEKSLLLLEEERFTTCFEGKTVEEANLVVSQAETEDKAAQQAKDFPQQKYTLALAVVPVVGLAAFAVSLIDRVPSALAWITVLCFLGAAVVGGLFYHKWRVMRRLEKRRDDTLLRLRAADLAALRHDLAEYEHLSEKGLELKAKLDTENQAADKLMEEMEALKSQFEETIHSFAPDITDLTEAFHAMTELGKVADRLDIALRERADAVHLFDTLVAAYEGDPAAPIPHDNLQMPLRSKEETVYDLKRMETELDTLKNSYAMAMGKVRALGDPVVLGAKRGALTTRLEELTRQYEALSLASEVLAEADSELGARFSPLLGKQAGQYLDRLTDGQYKRVVFDKQLTPSAERAGESVSRDVLYLSGGTVDQVYLALRLAICDLTFPADKACPIILDDALVSFDDIRIGSALTLLKELAAEKQIILFTCQNREAQFFQGAKDVHMINL